MAVWFAIVTGYIQTDLSDATANVILVVSRIFKFNYEIYIDFI